MINHPIFMILSPIRQNLTIDDNVETDDGTGCKLGFRFRPGSEWLLRL